MSQVNARLVQMQMQIRRITFERDGLMYYTIINLNPGDAVSATNFLEQQILFFKQLVWKFKFKILYFGCMLRNTW